MSNAAREAQRRATRSAEEDILRGYRQRTPHSAAMYARASKALVGGTTGNLRHFSPYPLYFATGAGCTMTDVDGNSYIDCFLCNGPLLLGHRHPRILQAIQQCADLGSIVVNPELAVFAAEAIQRTVPCAERVRFLNSGTEAVMAAVRVARAATGKSKIVKFFGHYHGQDDQFLVGLEPTRVAFGAGIPGESYASTLTVRYGDIDGLARVLEATMDVAAVILDPAMHAGGLWGSSTDYLRAVRDLTTRLGVVLIFDEVITGFRLAAGGAQALYGVTPDLVTLAKALGAGEKLAALAGSEAILRCLDPGRPQGTPAVFQSGTGNDGTAALAAGVMAVQLYGELERSGAYSQLNSVSQRLAEGLRSAFTGHRVPIHVNQLGPMLQLFLSDATPSFESFAGLPSGPVQLFYLALINEGVLLSLPTSNHVYLSFAHSEVEVDTVLRKVDVVLDRYDFGEIVRAGTPAT